MKSLKAVTAVIILIVIACGYFHSVLDGTRVLSERDLAVFFIPPRTLWVDILKGGEFPLWNPYSFAGHPLFATLQPGVLYPVNLLLLVLPFDLAFNWTIIVHFILAGSFTFFLLGELNASRAGSLAGALTFMLSGYLFSVHNVISTLFTVAWVPLLTLLFLRAVKRGSLFYSLLSGLVLTFMFLGGGIESLFGSFIFLFFLTLFPAALDFGKSGDGHAPAGKRFLLLGVSTLAFVLLSAVQLLPFLELANRSIRAGGLSYFEATTWSFDLKDFIQFFIPDPYGYGISDEKYWGNQSWLKTVYTGLTPILLTVFFLSKERRKALPAALIGIFFFSLAMGRNNFLYQYLYAWAPAFAKIRYPVKFLFMPFLLLSITTGLGLDRLLKSMKEGGRTGKRMAFLLLGVATVAAAALGALDFFGPQAKAFLIERGMDLPLYNRPEINIFNTKRLLFFFIAASVIIYGGFYFLRFRRLVPHSLVLVLAVDLFFAHNGFYGETKVREYHSMSMTMEHISGDKGLYRVFVTPKTTKEEVVVPADAPFEKRLLEKLRMDKERISGYNLEHRVFDINGVDVMMRGDFSSLYGLMISQERVDSTNILPMLNVKYVVSIPKIDSPEFALRKVIGGAGEMKELEDFGSLKIYENRNYLPRFYMAGDYRVIKRPEETASALLDKKFDPGKTVLLEEDPWPSGRPETGQRDDKINVASYGNNSIELKVANSSPGILVASESWYPGWKVFVDGVEKKILKADYILRAVPLEAGEHTVRFEYRPASFRTGAYVSAFALGLITAGLIWSRRREHR